MIVSFGRASPREALGDVWLLADGVWRELETTGERPRPRWSHTMTASDSSFVVVGGRDLDGAVSDLFVLSSTYAWSRLEPTVEVFAHAAVATTRGVLVLGGLEADRPFVCERGRVRRCHLPFSRFAHSAVALDDDEALVLGGVDMSDARDSPPSTDVLCLDRFRLADDLQRLDSATLLPPPDATLLPVHAAAVRLDPDLILLLGGGLQCFAFAPIFSLSFALRLGGDAATPDDGDDDDDDHHLLLRAGHPPPRPSQATDHHEPPAPPSCDSPSSPSSLPAGTDGIGPGAEVRRHHI
mmetsp:Transcript_24236/g.75785  ORF Transcript_24236/g.75785 Transcript_24236/m.75785 type:complete len:296 (+) Transcript_24236:382-1269(+)